MDAFESIVSELLWEEGYWTIVGYKVDLPKDKKVALGKPSYPRPEIDILAYQARENQLLWVECKSYLDSRGVKLQSLTGEDESTSKYYKTFTWPEYRKIVTAELVRQLVSTNRTRPNPTVRYCLVTGKIATEADRAGIKALFDENGWLLYDEHWIKQGLVKLVDKGYENDVAVIVAKLFARIG